MNAFRELNKKLDAGTMTDLDLCVFWHTEQDIAERAAAELFALRAALDEAKQLLSDFIIHGRYPSIMDQAYSWLKKFGDKQ
jgi:hypothetical protein